MTPQQSKLASALASHQNGQLDVAERAYRRILRQDPKHPDALHLLGLIAHQQQDHPHALELISQAIAQRPNVAVYHSNRGAVLRDMGQFDDAIADFRAAIRMDSAYAAARYNLAMAYESCGDEQLAEDAYREAIKTDPTFIQAYNNLGNLLLRTGRPAEAADQFRHAIEREPHSAELHFNLANALRDSQDSQQAEAELRRCLALQPSYSAAWNNLGSLLKDQQRWDEAREAFREVIRISPVAKEGHHNLGGVEESLGNLVAAEAHYRHAVEVDDSFVTAWIALARVLFYQKKVDEADRCAAKALELDPGQLQTHYAVGNALLNSGDFEAARRCFERIVARQPDHADCWNNLGNVYSHLARWEDCVRCYVEAIKLDPNQPIYHGNLADVYRNIGQLTRAREHFRKAASGPNGERLRLQSAFMLPPVYASMQEMLDWRGRLFAEIEQLEEQGFRYDAAQGLTPTTFYLGYQGFNERAHVERISQLIQSSFEPEQLGSDGKDGRIKIGFLSQFFKSHTIGSLMEGLISELPRDRFQVSVFSHIDHPGPIAERIRKHCDQFVILSENVPRALRLLADARLDVLFYADIGMDPFTNSLARSRLAPVQCVTWGHPMTTGCPEIDYFISSDLIETADAQDHYTERLIRLKDPPAYYRSLPSLPKVKSRTDFGLPAEARLYACPQSLFKMHPEFDGYLRDILHCDLQGHIVLIHGLHRHWSDSLSRRLRRVLSQAFDRVHFLPRLNGDDFLNLMSVSDVILDPIHFGGGNTSYQALGLGIPVITQPSPYMRGRVTAGLLRQAGINDTIAASRAEYVWKATGLARDIELRADLKQRLLDAREAVFENRSAVSELADFLERAVRAGHRKAA